MQDLNDKVTGGNVTAAEWNQVPSELQNVIVALGLTLSSGDLNQLGKALVTMAGAASHYVDTGAADAYVVGAIGGKQAPPFLNAAADGLLVRFRPVNNNTGASTVNVNGLGAKTITREDGNALALGDLMTTRDALLRYQQSTDSFLLLDASLPQDRVNTVAFRGYVDGFILSNDPGDAANDIAVSPGIARDSTDAATMKRLTSITKRLDAAWAAGSGAGGFPTGLTRTSGIWYHVYLIRNPASGAVDVGVDSSLTAVNLLADATGFIQFRRIGAIKTIAGPANKLFHQYGDEFLWLDSEEDFDGAGSTAGALEALDFVPTGVRVWAIINAYTAVGAGQLLLSSGDVNNATESNDPPNLTLRCNGGTMATNGVGPIRLRTNASAQIRHKQTNTSNWKLVVRGWIDPRGQDA